MLRVIPKSLARQLGNIFKFMYRRGINDADLHSDDLGMIHEHIEQTSYSETFGFLEHQTKNWIYWRNRLTDQLETNKGCYRLLENYWLNMGRFKSNYQSVVLVAAQEFYNMGLRDYVTDPHKRDLEIYNDGEIKTWIDGRKFDGYKLRNLVQDICIRHMERIDEGEEDPLTRNHYDVFMTAFSFSIVAK